MRSLLEQHDPLALKTFNEDYDNLLESMNEPDRDAKVNAFLNKYSDIDRAELLKDIRKSNHWYKNRTLLIILASSFLVLILSTALICCCRRRPPPPEDSWSCL